MDPAEAVASLALPALLPAAPIATTIVDDADATDEQLIAMWLHGRSAHTVRAYRRDVQRFRAFVEGKPLRAVTLRDLQGFSDSLTGKSGTRARILAAVKSLLSFASKLGALRFNVGAALKTHAGCDGLADRILAESDVARMLALTVSRDHARIRLAYAGGFRVAELVSLRWSDLADAADGTLYLTVYRKGGKTRTVRVSAATGKVMRSLRSDAPLSGFVFGGRGGALNPSQTCASFAPPRNAPGLKRP
jgi:integrase/recombinase XerD